MRLTPEELVRQKARHTLVREALRKTYRIGGSTQRYTLLLWGLVRGFPYRRIERQHHVQAIRIGKMFEHNLPKLAMLSMLYETVLGEHANARELEAWLANPDGAIPAPPPRAKKPYVRPGEGPAPASPEAIAALARAKELLAEYETAAEVEAASDPAKRLVRASER